MNYSAHCNMDGSGVVPCKAKEVKGRTCTHLWNLKRQNKGIHITRILETF